MSHAHTSSDVSLAQSPSTEKHLTRDVMGGVIAGQISGLIMAVVVMVVFTVFLGKGPLFPVQVIGSIVTGDVAVQGFHLPSLLAGLLAHQLGPSLMWGVAFGVAVHAFGVRRGGGLAAVALLTGVISQIVDVHIVGPVAFNALHGHDIWAENVPLFWSWAAHVVFGLGLLVYPRVRARLG